MQISRYMKSVPVWLVALIIIWAGAALPSVPFVQYFHNCTNLKQPNQTGSDPSEAPFSDNYAACLRTFIGVPGNATGFQIGHHLRMDLLVPTDIGNAADFIGRTFQQYINADQTAGSPLARGSYINNGAITVGPKGKINRAVGYNPELYLDAGSFARDRIPFRAQYGGYENATEVDAVHTTYMSYGDKPPPDWLLLSERGVAKSIRDNLVRSAQAFGLKSYFDLWNVSCTDWVLRSPNVTIDCAGNITTVGSVTASNSGGGTSYYSSDVPASSAISLANVTPTNLTSLILPMPGDYDVSWRIACDPTGSGTLQQVASSVSLTSNTLDGANDRTEVMHWGTAGITLSGGNAIRSGGAAARFVTTVANTTVYLVVLSQFPSGSGCNASGKVWARKFG
jgi:hypothetical protein